MAIIGPYNVSITVGGIELPEYDPPEDEELDKSIQPDRQQTKYIEVTEGSEFGMKVRFIRGVDRVIGTHGICLTLDGQWELRCRLTVKDDQNVDVARFLSPPMILEDNVWVTRPYVFRKLATTDAECEKENLKRIAGHVGSIIFRFYNTEPMPGVFVPGVAKPLTVDDVPEKVLKGQSIDLSAGLGKASACSSPEHESRWRVTGDPLFQIVFKYRSRRALQLLDLIPMTPETIPLHARDPATLDLEEARELLSQMQARLNKLEGIESEDPKIKEERGQTKETSLTRAAYGKRNASHIDDGDDDVIFVKSRKTERLSSTEIEVLDLS